MKRILFLVLVLPNLLIGCYSRTDYLKVVKETYPDAEIYRVDKFEFILIDSVGLWYIDSNDIGRYTRT